MKKTLEFTETITYLHTITVDTDLDDDALGKHVDAVIQKTHPKYFRDVADFIGNKEIKVDEVCIDGDGNPQLECDGIFDYVDPSIVDDADDDFYDGEED